MALVVISFASGTVTGDVDEPSEYSDPDEDVLLADDREPPYTLDDLVSIGENLGNQDEARSIDIISLTVESNKTYITFSLQTVGKIVSDEDIVYSVAGYIGEDPLSSDRFDFLLSFTEGNGSYFEFREGKLQYVGPLSREPLIDSNRLSMTMNQNAFITSGGDDPIILYAYTLMYPPDLDSRSFYIDTLRSDSDGDDGVNGLDDMTIIMIQVGFFVFMFITIIVIYNYWLKKKGVMDQSGVCPRCEAKLDPSLDFCPSCGSFIRGPEADRVMSKDRVDKEKSK